VDPIIVKYVLYSV